MANDGDDTEEVIPVFPLSLICTIQLISEFLMYSHLDVSDRPSQILGQKRRERNLRSSSTYLAVG